VSWVVGPTPRVGPMLGRFPSSQHRVQRRERRAAFRRAQRDRLRADGELTGARRTDVVELGRDSPAPIGAGCRPNSHCSGRDTTDKPLIKAVPCRAAEPGVGRPFGVVEFEHSACQVQNGG
jgi:hypothetical protein